MPLTVGTRLGPYEILAPLGAGGMGEVYRARDSRLGREVAIKVLPPQLGASAEVRARFEREAKTVSSLNHPHICTLHDVGRAPGEAGSGDIDFLVMELVDGETLAQRLEKGALPVGDVLKFGAQIADALDRAHRAGVIHRDLKPGNVMLTRSGAKLMDFGLARPTGMVAPSSSGVMSALTQSPTVAAPLTTEGALLGTFQYMAPEQLEGREADVRSDVWALGCVLYEMTTGKRAFEGRSQASLIAAIIGSEPAPISNVAPMAPATLDRMVRACLAKEPDDRIQSAHDVRLQLSWIAEGDTGIPATGVKLRGRMSKRAQVSWTLGASIIAAFAGVLATRLFDRGLAPSGGRTTRVIAMAPLTDLPGHQQSPSLSSDGKMLLFVARDGLDSDVFLLRVGGENPVNLTEDHLGDDEDPAFSPDGERIAFRSEREGGGIFVMGATGESPRKLTSEGAHPAWSPDGRQIAYSTEHVGNPTARLTTSSLWLVDVSTGEAKRLYEGDAVQPAWSPSGRRIVFWAADQGQRDIRTIAAEGGPVSDVTRDPATDWGAFWAPDGRSIFFLSDRGGSPDLWRVAIDEGSGRPRGEPQPVTTGVARVTAGSISADGSRVAIEVVEARGEILKLGFDPVQARVRGTPDLVFASGNPIVQTSLAPAGDWIAYRTTAPAENIFVMRSDGSERRRLTDDSFRNRGPRWVRGSEWLIFYTNRTGDYEPWLMRRDGTELRRLTDQPKSEVTQPVVSPDGNGVVFSVGGTLPRLGFTSLGDEWFVPGKPPAPVKFELVAEDFIPNAWAPDGERILGTTASGTDRRLAIYSTATRRVELFEHLRAAGGTWLPDSRRILCVGSRRRSAVVWDVVSQQVQEVPGFSGFSGDLRLSSDGRTLVMTRNVTEGDIWLLTLK